MSVTWIQLECITCHDQTQALEALLLEAGAQSITFSETEESQSLWEPDLKKIQLWQQVKLIALFSAETFKTKENSFDTDSLTRDLVRQFELDALHWVPLQDRPWEREWLKYFKPVVISDTLTILPSEYEQSFTVETPFVLALDPGLAFGTGSHPTTLLCLEWLCEQDLKESCVIDYGCGSGILAIAAALMGAKTVIATDIDCRALDATHDNAKRNQVADNIKTCLPQQLDELLITSATPDLLIANILAQPLHQLKQRFSELLKPKGHFAISGIMCHQVEALKTQYEQCFILQESRQTQEWALLSGCKP